VPVAHPAVPVQNEQGGPRIEARELLDRWASSHLFDPYGPPQKNVESGGRPVTRQPNHPAGPVDPRTTAGPAADLGSQQGVFPQPSVVESAPTTPLYQSPPPPHMQPARSNTATTAGHMPHMFATSGIAEPNVVSTVPGSHTPPPGVEGSLTEVVPQPPSPVVRPDVFEAVEPTAGTVPTDNSPTGRDLLSSADELDRLTNEILSRVSQISEDRRQRIELAAAEIPEDATVELEQESDVVGGIDLTRRVDTTHDSMAAHVDFVESHEMRDATESPSDSEPTQVASTLHTSADSVASTTTEVDRQATEADAASASGMPGIGQILSYIGILGLTAGTSFVIVGYFGGPASYAPTGWLVATIGQMLLFLGIVTLVSNGMEQTSAEVQQTVNSRIDELSGRLESLGDKLIRIESAEADGPRRPHVLDRSESTRPKVRAANSRDSR